MPPTAPDVSCIPKDNPEFTLDPHSNWYDVKLCAPITNTTAFKDAPTPVKMKKKSLHSVHFTSADFVLDIVDLSWLEKASCILEAKLSKPISQRNAEVGRAGRPSRGNTMFQLHGSEGGVHGPTAV